MNAPQKPENLTPPHTNAAWHQRRLAATPRGVGRDKSLHAFDKYTEVKTTWIRIDSPLHR